MKVIKTHTRGMYNKLKYVWDCTIKKQKTGGGGGGRVGSGRVGVTRELRVLNNFMK